MNEDSRIKLTNATLGNFEFFEPKKYSESSGDAKYFAIFLFDPKDQQIVKLREKILQMMVTKFGQRTPRSCLKPGDQRENPLYASYETVSANNTTAPILIDKNRMPITLDNNLFYPGCRVNALINLWAQSNSNGKAINANLLAVQFAGDGEKLPIGVPTINIDEYFEPSEDGDSWL